MNRSAPVFNSQTVHTFKFPGVISHNNQSPTAGMSKRKLTAVCSHQTRIGNLDAHLI